MTGCGVRLAPLVEAPASSPSRAKVDVKPTYPSPMNYMDQVLTELRERYGLDEEGTEYVRGELVRSFKNGLKRGRGRESGSLDSSRRWPRLNRKHGKYS